MMESNRHAGGGTGHSRSPFCDRLAVGTVAMLTVLSKLWAGISAMVAAFHTCCRNPRKSDCLKNSLQIKTYYTYLNKDDKEGRSRGCRLGSVAKNTCCSWEDHSLISAPLWLCTDICNSSLRESDGARPPCGAQTYTWEYSCTHK